MLRILLALAALALFAVPAVSAQPSLPVYPGCYSTNGTCAGGNDFCGPSWGQTAPMCRDIPACEHSSCIGISLKQAPPQSYPACVARVTAPSCYGGYDVCSPYASLQRPACTNVPECAHYSCISVNAKPIPVPVGACVDGVGQGCARGVACVGVGGWVPQCVPGPCEQPWFACAPSPIGLGASSARLLA